MQSYSNDPPPKIYELIFVEIMLTINMNDDKKLLITNSMDFMPCWH